jgi:hypothetical protein
MKTFSLVIGIMFVWTASLGAYQELNTNHATNLTRSAFPATTAATTMACDNTGTLDSGILSMPSQYMIVCSADTQLRWSATTDVTATTNDFLLPAKTVMFFATGGRDHVNRVSCYSAASTCYVLEMR